MSDAAEPAYSARDVARIFGLQESRVLYWARTGVVGPSLRRGSRSFYSFQDLITLKAAKELLDGGVSLQAVRKNLAALRSALPEVDRPVTRLRIVSDGDRLVVVGDEAPFEPLTGQLVMDFAVGALQTQVARLMQLPARPQGDASPRSARSWFLHACSLDDDDERIEEAAAAYAKALELDPALAAAHTNLGNLEHRRGRRGDARGHYEQALAIDPGQPEARYNLANLLAELGDHERAINEWTMVVAMAPDFADAHFNLGSALVRRGDEDAARVHLKRYLEIDASGEWAERARELLDRL